jgi:site-specific DNA-methyltransferase (adenine-specific)
MTSATVQRAAARRRAEDLIATISEIGAVRSLREIAEELTQRGVPTDRGGQWHPQTVARVLDRLGITSGIELRTGEMMAMCTLPLRFVNAVITSPPYANQRKREYGGINEADYPMWTVEWMNKLRPVLVDGGNVAIVIRPHVKDGALSDYVLRTRLAVRDAGWHEIEELKWIKPSAAPIGHTRRPRRSWESILWFSNSTRPYCDPVANGTPSARLGLVSKKGVGRYIHGISSPQGVRSGLARCRDYVEVSASAVNRDHSNSHPAQYLKHWQDG